MSFPEAVAGPHHPPILHEAFKSSGIKLILFHVLALHRDLASVPRLQALLQVRDRVMALLQFLL